VDGAAFTFPYLGIQTMVNDVLDWDILGARLYLRPLAGLDSALLKELEFGVTAAVDFDPQQEYGAVDIGPPHDNSSSVSVSTFSADAGLPLIKGENMDLLTYVEWGLVSGKGNGITLGADYRYKWLRLYGQFSYLGERFVVNYFDPFYLVERPAKYDSLDAYTESYLGYLAGIGFDVNRVGSFYFTWQDNNAKVTQARVRTGFTLADDLWDRVDFDIAYDKKDIDSFDDFFSFTDSLLEVTFVYTMTQVASIAFQHRYTFAPPGILPSGSATSQSRVETRFLF
jgi:hypothetical protein